MAAVEIADKDLSSPRDDSTVLLANFVVRGSQLTDGAGTDEEQINVHWNRHSLFFALGDD
jgi:hypothetical protein